MHPSPLYILRFDHRVPFSKGLFGIDEASEPTAAQHTAICDLKLLVYEALLAATESAVARGLVLAVVDEHYAADVAIRARADGIATAVAVEQSGRDEFAFEYDDFASHVDRLNPDYVKALARFNVEGDAASNDRQLERLSVLASWARTHDRPIVFELMVPPTPAQLSAVDGKADVFRRNAQPPLVEQAIAALTGAGLRPEVWMLPGTSTARAFESLASRAHAEGNDAARCVVLGQGPNADTVAEWIRVARDAPGCAGFAVAQTIWMPTLRRVLAGDLDRATARAHIAAAFVDAVSIFEGSE